jgi:hypothetical protein
MLHVRRSTDVKSGPGRLDVWLDFDLSDVWLDLDRTDV